MRVAILGCGQLARMQAQAANELGVECAFVAFGNETTDCVEGLGPVVRWSPGDEAGRLFRALGEPSVITLERESIEVGLLRELQAYCQVSPGPASVLVGQNRKFERQMLQSLDIPCAPFRVVSSPADVLGAVDILGLPLVAKATESGYDGKLQWRLRSQADVERFCGQGCQGEWLLEQWVEFEREVSVVAARSAHGEFRAYPLTENHHREGILLTSVAPARGVPADLQAAALGYVETIMTHLDYVGVMAVEFFIVGGAVWVNELAPRVHNSGHWTMTGDVASQFENHMRAILGLPLGDTHCLQPAGMINILGGDAVVNLAASENHGMQVHLYNKSPAPRRKLGHINVTGVTADELVCRLGQLQHELYGEHRCGVDASL